MMHVPFNRRLILFLWVGVLVGLEMFMKLGLWFLVGTIAGLIVLTVFFAIKAGKESLRAAPSRDYRPFVSVIIPAHNEEAVIASAVSEAFKLRYHKEGRRKYEVWVVDDRSTDRTPLVIRDIKKRHPHLKVLSRGEDDFPGKAAALNHCFPLTRGDVILVLDADAHFPPDLISKTVGYLAPDDIGGAQVAKRIANPETNSLCRRQADEYKVDIGVQLGRDAVGGAVEFKGNGSFIKRSALETVGGWTNFTITEDLDLSTKMLLQGYCIRFVSETCVWEQAAPDLAGFFKQRLRWVEGSMLRYLVHLPGLLKGPMHPRQRFDMVVFLLEFAIPIYVFFDVLTQPLFALFAPSTGEFSFMKFPMSMINLGVILVGLTVFLAVKLVSQYIREHRWGFWEIVGRTAATMFYMLHWFPVVIAATFNLLFGLEAQSWKKVKRISTEEVVKA